MVAGMTTVPIDSAAEVWYTKRVDRTTNFAVTRYCSRLIHPASMTNGSCGIRASPQVLRRDKIAWNSIHRPGRWARDHADRIY
jgi:hypothetical protein